MKTILKLDSSALRNSSCPLAFKHIVIDGYREPQLTNDVLYGIAFHKFISTMYESGGNFGTAKDAALAAYRKPCIVKNKKEHLTETHLLKTCIDCWQLYIEKEDFSVLSYPDGKPVVEMTFEFPYYDSPELQIDLAGTIDRTGRVKNGCYCIRDWKSTSSWDSKAYLKQYAISPQLKFYVWSIKRYIQFLGITEGPLFDILKHPIGAAIDGVFLKSNKETEFLKSEVYIYKEKELEEFRLLVDWKVNQLVEIFKSGRATRMGLIEGTCSNGKSLCKFFEACVGDEVTEQHVLRNNFIVKQYDPLKFNE